MILKQYLKESNYLAQVVTKASGCELTIPARKFPLAIKRKKILYKIDKEKDIISKSADQQENVIESTPYSHKLFILLDTNIECQKAKYPLDLIEYKDSNDATTSALEDVLGLNNTIVDLGLELALTTLVSQYYEEPTSLGSLKDKADKCGVGEGFSKFCSYFIEEKR